jgi:hypothetical protein
MKQWECTFKIKVSESPVVTTKEVIAPDHWDVYGEQCRMAE